MNRLLRLPLLLLFFLMLTPAVTAAQDEPSTPQALATDVESLDAIMAAVYDVISGGQGVERDWDRFRSLFHPEARLMPSGCNAEGNCRVQIWSVEEYIQIAGPGLMARGFFETETHRVVEQFGHIAHVFSTYDSRWTPEDPEPFQRGINSFQLMNDGSRWWVLHIFWRGETPDTPIPAKYGG